MKTSSDSSVVHWRLLCLSIIVDFIFHPWKLCSLHLWIFCCQKSWLFPRDYHPWWRLGLLLMGSNCCIGLSTLGGGLVLLRNGGTGWGILDASFTLYSTLKFLLVSSFGGYVLVRLCSMLLLVVVSLKSFYSRVNIERMIIVAYCF